MCDVRCARCDVRIAFKLQMNFDHGEIRAVVDLSMVQAASELATHPHVAHRTSHRTSHVY